MAEYESKYKQVFEKDSKCNVFNDAQFTGPVTINAGRGVNAAVKTIVPDELNTEQAQVLLKKLQGAGWLDEALQPVGMSRAKAAVLAHSIADELGIKNMWSLFGDLWNMKALANAYQDGINQQGMGDFLDEFARIIG